MYCAIAQLRPMERIVRFLKEDARMNAFVEIN